VVLLGLLDLILTTNFNGVHEQTFHDAPGVCITATVALGTVSTVRPD
jgi:hypothetical protein